MAEKSVDRLVVEFVDVSSESTTVNLVNKTDDSLYYFDSLFVSELPYYFWYRLCAQGKQACDDIEWVSPHLQVSSFIKTPVKLTELKANGVKTKVVNFDSLNNFSLADSLAKGYSVQFKIRIYNDSELLNSNDFVSGWLKTGDNTKDSEH